MLEKLKKLKKREYQEMLKFIKCRPQVMESIKQSYGDSKIANVKDFADNYSPDTDRENTCYELWMQRWLELAILEIEKFQW